MKTKKLLACVTVLTVSATTALASQPDPSLPTYQVSSGISGNLSSVGSDTLANLMTLWAKDFKRLYPVVNVQVQAAGSSAAPPALTESTANFGPMSRKMNNNELAAFERKHGYQPTGIPVAIDVLAVFVNKDNPIKGLTLAELDGIFSANRKCGADGDVQRWGDVGLGGFWQHRPVQLYGRNSASGTYGYFKHAALCKGDFKNSVNEQPGSASVVQSVSSSLNGIGYSGIGYQAASVRTVALAKTEGQPFVEATPANAVDGSYPLSRFLYIYVNKQPNKPLSPLEGEFVRLILSEQGQEAVVKNGYIPLPDKIVDQYLTRLELNNATAD